MARHGVSLNHVILYAGKVEPSLRFYRDLLGFEVIESVPGYARLRSPGGGATIALHASAEPKPPARTRAVVLYFETPELTQLCRRLRKKGVKFAQLPKRMPWGWDHAYLKDPEGHSISLYWAGPKRFKKTPRLEAT